MGRVKTSLVKRTTLKLVEMHGLNKFEDNFDNNKKILSTLIYTPSKKIRNTVAGYLTRLVKKKKEAS